LVKDFVGMDEEIERSLELRDRGDALLELGLAASASDNDIRRAFRTRLKAAHPDLNGGNDGPLRRLIRARDLLVQDVKSANDALEPQAVTDSAITLRISLEQALHGGETFVEAPALEHAHAHEPLVSLRQTKRLRVIVPAGLRDGERRHLSCDSGAETPPIFAVHIDAGPNRRVFGDDIWATAAIDARIFVNGGRATIDTPWGPREIEIGSAFPRGSSLRLKGLGLPASGMRNAGDLHVRLEAREIKPRAYLETLSDFRQKWAS
jgi:curved DNA-binding protein